MEQKKKIFLEGKKLVFLKKKFLEKFRKKFCFDFFQTFSSSSRANNFFEEMRLHYFLGTISGYLHAKNYRNLKNGYRDIIIYVAKHTKYCWKIPFFGAHPGQIIFFSKNGLHHFLGEPSGYLHAKFQKNLPSGYREKLVTDGRTDELTNELTNGA